MSEWKRAPVKATRAMEDAGERELLQGRAEAGTWADRMGALWAAMLAVAPMAPREADTSLEPITNEEIDRIAGLTLKAMPNGISGFAAAWGWQQFGRLLLENLRPYGLRHAEPAPAPAPATVSRALSQLVEFRAAQIAAGIPEEDLMPANEADAVAYLITNMKEWR